jgi:hypothetical protein
MKILLGIILVIINDEVKVPLCLFTVIAIHHHYVT